MATMQTMSENEALEQYNEYLNEVYGDVTIAGIEYPTSQALKEVDPIAYRTGFNDWMDSEDIELE